MPAPIPLAVSLVSCHFGEAPPVAEAFPECVTGRQPAPAGDLERVFAPGPATCNDGSPPVMHLREASDPAHADDWVIYLEGGHSCDDAASCRERWCSSGHNRMTSTLSAARQPGTGLASARPDNPFAGWNVAVLHYCSSDQWLGEAEAPVRLSSWFQSYTVRFEGHPVLLQLLDALDAGATTEAGTTLPSLDRANKVLFAGTSAGGAGATFHLDDVSARYPNARVVGFVDGIMSPAKEVLDPESRDLAEHRESWGWAHRGDTWDAFHREACERSGGNCQDPGFLWGTYVKSPVVLRFDLRDPVVADAYVSNGGMPMAQLVRGLTAVAKRLETVARPDRAAVVTDCAFHAAAGDDAGTFDMSVRADGRDWRAVDAAWRLLVEGEATLALDSPGGKASRCPTGGRDELP